MTVALQTLIKRTDPSVLRDPRLLRLFFTRPLQRSPEYLAAILQHLEVHVNFLYRDPLRILLTGIRDVLMRVTRPPRSKCPPRNSSSNSSTSVEPYLQNLTPRTLEQALILPQLYDASTVHWRTKGRALVRPYEVAPQGSLHEDGLLLSTEELETFFDNSRQFLDVLLEYGLGQERLQYLQPIEQGQYLAPLLELFRVATTPRIRRFAIDYAFQLVPLGIDLYHDLFFQTLHNLMRAGSLKTVEDCDLEENLSHNFDKITDLLTFWIRAGFNINYQYAKVLTFAESHGVQTDDNGGDSVRLQTVSYTGCSALALAAIYNRADVGSWLLQFCGPIPIESAEEEDIFPRVLDTTNPLYEVNDEKVESAYITIPVILRSTEGATSSQCESNILEEEEEGIEWNIFQVARRHNAKEMERLLVAYGELTSRTWHTADPLIHDVRQIGYEI